MCSLATFFPLNLKLIKFFDAFSHIIGQKIFIQKWQHTMMMKVFLGKKILILYNYILSHTNP